MPVEPTEIEMPAMSSPALPVHDLRGPGRILLVSCYELGHTPHGLAMPLGFLERAGFAPACLDLSIETLNPELVDRALLVAISVPMHTALRLGASVIERVRNRNPAARICLFGLYAPLNAAYLGKLGADWVLGGESEEALVRIARKLDEDLGPGVDRDPGRDPGRGVDPDLGRDLGHDLGPRADRDREHGVKAPAGAAPEPAVSLVKLDFARPSRRSLPTLSRYARFERADGTRWLAGYTETSRGCLDTCRHCPVPSVYGGRFFVIPEDVVLGDIAAQVALGAEHITFGDPDFLNGPRHGMSILRRMHEAWPRLTFDITAQITHLRKHRRYLAELAELGCAFVVSAVESLSDEVLARLAKRHRRADFEEALALCRDAGLTLRPTFVPFTPWTRLDDMRELVDFMVAHDLVASVEPVQLTIRLLVPPGSLLLDDPGTRALMGALDPARLTHVWTHADARVDELQVALARRVEQAARSNEAPASTFQAVRELVYRACGHTPPPGHDIPRRRAPRLSEPWFC